eukprot:1186530-Prorocentrum_minimum.AAC.2
MPCAECFTSVDSRQLSTVELKSKAFLAVDSGAWCTPLLRRSGLDLYGNKVARPAIAIAKVVAPRAAQ